jgi:hypothetical protein
MAPTTLKDLMRAFEDCINAIGQNEIFNKDEIMNESAPNYEAINPVDGAHAPVHYGPSQPKPKSNDAAKIVHDAEVMRAVNEGK